MEEQWPICVQAQGVEHCSMHRIVHPLQGSLIQSSLRAVTPVTGLSRWCRCRAVHWGLQVCPQEPCVASLRQYGVPPTSVPVELHAVVWPFQTPVLLFSASLPPSASRSPAHPTIRFPPTPPFVVSQGEAGRRAPRCCSAGSAAGWGQ